MHKPISSESGMLLLFLALAMACVAGAMVFVFQRSDMMMNEWKTVQARERTIAMRAWFKVGHSCSRTLAINPGACVTGANISLGRSGAGAPPNLIQYTAPSTYTTMEGLRLRARCSGTATKTITLEAQPISDLPTATTWKNLFPGEVIVCP